MAIVSKGIISKDRQSIEEILRSTEYFYDFEIQTALEIADETLTKGMETSGYYWMKISDEDGVIAFANYGKNAFSTHSWDLYWIAVHQNSRNKNLVQFCLRQLKMTLEKWAEKSFGSKHQGDLCMLRLKPFTAKTVISSRQA
jgi:hypothetical protein